MMTETDTIAPRRSGLGYIFIGDEGLRAGWSLLLFIVFASLIGIALAAVLPHGTPDRPGTPATPLKTIRTEVIGFGVVAVASLLVSLIERRPFTRYGLRRERALPDLLIGMAWGIAMLSLLVALLWVSGGIAFQGVALSGSDILGYGAAWFVAFTLVGLFEEYLTRGFLQYTLARGVAGIVSALTPSSTRARTIGFWVAAAVCSIGLFTVPHAFNTGETAMGLVSVALAGLTFVYVLYRTGSLWWAIGFHATWDWMQSYFYGTSDSGLVVQGHLLQSHPAGAALLSGGDTGPEGSILVVPVLALTILIIHRTLPRRASAFDA